MPHARKKQAHRAVVRRLRGEKIAVPQVNLVPRPEGVEAWRAPLLEPLAASR